MTRGVARRVLGWGFVPAVLLLAAFLAGGCARALPAPSAGDAVRAADASMARATEARDAAAFGSHVAPDAIWAGARGLSSGKAAVLEQWRPFLEPGGATLGWTPTASWVAASGELACTVGTWVWRGAGPDGRPARAEGAYATVWRRDASGGWRALFDVGNRPAAEVAPGARRVPVAAVSSAAGDLAAEIGTWSDGARTGAWMTVRVRQGGGWHTFVDAAVPFRP